MPNRHTPQRTCMSCGTKHAKRDLYRIVRSSAGACSVDPSGKLPGRGAYLCGKQGCWRSAAQGKRIAAALRGEVSPEDRERLAAFGRELAQDAQPVRAAG